MDKIQSGTLSILKRLGEGVTTKAVTNRDLLQFMGRETRWRVVARHQLCSV